MNSLDRHIDFSPNTNNTKKSQSPHQITSRKEHQNNNISSSITKQKSFNDVYQQQHGRVKTHHHDRQQNARSNTEKRAIPTEQLEQKKHSLAGKKEIESGKKLPSEGLLITKSTHLEKNNLEMGSLEAIILEAGKPSSDNLQELNLEEEKDTDANYWALHSAETDKANFHTELLTSFNQQEQNKLIEPALTKGSGRNSVETVAPHLTNSTTLAIEDLIQPRNQLTVDAENGLEFKALNGTLGIDNAKFSISQEILASSTTAATESTTDHLPSLNALTQSTQNLAPRPGLITTNVHAPVDSPEWGNAVSQRIMWLVNRGISGAELQLNPRDLGPVDVRINMNGDQASVQFTSQHAAVREVLESSMARLREMMEANGLDLADVNVSDQSPSEQPQSDSNNLSSANSAEGENEEPDDSAATQNTQSIEASSLVDFYA